MRCHNTHIPQYFCIYGVENCREDRGRVLQRFSSWVQLGPVLSLSRPRGAKLQGFTGLTDFYPAHPVPEILAITDFSAQLTLIQSSDSKGHRTITSAAGLGCENVLNWDGSL